MKRITTLSSLFLIGTTVSLIMKSWLLPARLRFENPEEDYHLYL